MTIHVKDGGVWKEASLYVRDGGTWKAVNEGYIKDAGTWKQFFMNRVAASLTISSNTANYTLNTAKVSGYVAGKTDVTLTINSGVVVYSNSTGTAAFIVDNSWTTGDTLTIINNGTILGRGGDGGRGYGISAAYIPGLPGASGGLALSVARAVSINNVNRISGGGGGGGGGGYGQLTGCCPRTGSGGGGGGGIGGSSGGGAHTSYGGQPGSGGTLTTNGSGGVGGFENPARGGTGGAGGTYGSSGGAGGSGSGGDNNKAGYAGGAAGAAVSGNSNITWIATGTRNGGIS
jgi:hypothetical protein